MSWEIFSKTRIEYSRSSEFIGIELPCDKIQFQNTDTKILYSRFEDYNGEIAWRKVLGGGGELKLNHEEELNVLENDAYRTYAKKLRKQKIKTIFTDG